MSEPGSRPPSERPISRRGVQDSASPSPVMSNRPGTAFRPYVLSILNLFSLKLIYSVNLGVHLPGLLQVLGRVQQQDLPLQWELDTGDNQPHNELAQQFNMLEM